MPIFAGVDFYNGGECISYFRRPLGHAPALLDKVARAPRVTRYLFTHTALRHMKDHMYSQNYIKFPTF